MIDTQAPVDAECGDVHAQDPGLLSAGDQGCLTAVPVRPLMHHPTGFLTAASDFSGALPVL